MAGALSLALAGPRVYGGIEVADAVMGDGRREATAAPGQHQSVRDRYVRVRLLAGLLLPATAYVTGLRAQRWYLGELRTALDQFDLLAQPALPMLPPRIGQEMVVLHGETLPFRLAVIPFNSPWTLAGAPVASVPCGFVAGLPVGLALAGRPGEDATVLRAAAAFQRASDWHGRRPEPAVGTVSTDPP